MKEKTKIIDERKLFQGAAKYYAKYRREYPRSLYDHLAKVFHLNKDSRALDLGTGTGQIAIPMSSIVGEVVAVDPDREMLAEGKKQAKAKVINNIIWINNYAEKLSDEMGRFDVATMGASFHWMKQDEVLRRVYDVTNKGGGVAIIYHTSTFHRNLGHDKWKDVAIAVVERYLGQKRRAGKGTFDNKREPYEAVLARSRFTLLDTYKEEYRQDWTIGQIIGFLYSTSYAAKRLFGDLADEFESELQSELLKINSQGKFIETARLEALLGIK